MKEIIEQELLKRGFTAKIKCLNYRDDGKGLAFETEEFNTTPVIMKSIKIQSSLANRDEDGLWAIQIKVRYEHFDNRHGIIGCDLFVIYIRDIGAGNFILHSVR